MSEGLIDSDAAARLLGITLNELNLLTKDGVLERQQGKYHIVGLIQRYSKHLKSETKRQEENPTQIEIARHLDMSDRNLRDVLKNLNLDHKDSSLSDVRVAYIRDLRDKAAGRGGEDQSNLAKARAEESMIKAAKLRLEYQRDIGALVLGEDAEKALNDWARFANREIIQGFHKLVSEIQSAYSLQVNPDMVDSIVKPTTDRIRDHAQKLGADIVAGGAELPEAEHRTDGGLH